MAPKISLKALLLSGMIRANRFARFARIGWFVRIGNFEWFRWIGLTRYKNRGFNCEMIRANRFARIALRIARATKFCCLHRYRSIECSEWGSVSVHVLCSPAMLLSDVFHATCQGPLNRGGFKRGFPDLDSLFLSVPFFVFCPFFVPFGLSRFFSGTFPIFGDFPDWSVSSFLASYSLLKAPMRNSPERVRDTIRTFPAKSGKFPGLETPQARKRNPNPNFWVRIFFGWGGGSKTSTWRGGGQKVRYVPRNQGNHIFLAGYPRILPGYPGGGRKVREKKSLCSFFGP